MSRKLPFLFALLLWGNSITAQIPTIIIDEQLSEPVIVSQLVAYFQDDSGKLSLNEALEKVSAGELTSAIPGEVSLPEEAGVYWLAFQVVNSSLESKDFILDFENWLKVDFYAQADSPEIIHKRSGHKTPFVDRDVQVANRSLISLHLEAKQTIQCYVRLETNRSYGVMPKSLIFSILNPSSVRTWEMNVRSLVAFFTGLFIFMLVFNFFIYFTTKDKDYLYYLALLLVMVAVPVSNFGYSVELLQNWEWYVNLHAGIDVLISFLLGNIILLFTNVFFKTRQRLPWFWWTSAVIIGLSFFAFLPLLNRDIMLAKNVIGIVSLVGIVLMLTIGVLGVIRKYPSAIYYLLGQAVFLLSGMVMMLSLVGVIPITEYTMASVPAGATLQNVLLSFALANKLNILRRENQQKQEAIITQLEKNETLQAARLEEEQVLNQRLQAMDQLKDQFLANTSHELRTPLNGIIGISESIFDDAAKIHPDALKNNLGLIISSGKRLSSLVNDLLDFSRLKNQDLHLQQKPIDLYSLTDIVLRVNAPLASGKNLQLINNISPEEQLILADENRLQQVLHNIVGNAIKFSESGQVKVGAQPKGEFLEIFVSDTGIGIPVDKQEAIFEEFQQADGSISRTYSGTGLGLTITRQLIELQGGQIWLESELGKGSIFFFTLPLAKDVEKNAAVESIRKKVNPVKISPPLTEKSGYITKTEILLDGTKVVLPQREDLIEILLVDDEPINLQVLRNLLENPQVKLTSALSGMEALHLLEEGRKFDLILLDVMMPRMSGFEVCQKIREKHLPSELPIIIITAKNQIQDMVEGLQFGANDYITKPFFKDEFLARIKTHLNLHHIHSITQKFVPVEFIRSLGLEGITDVRLGDHIAKNITVCFSDIRGYTSLAETMEITANFNFVNAYAGRMGPIIKGQQGFVHQYLGDGIMAIFQHRIENGLDAAILMHQEIRRYNEERILKKRLPISIGVGLHTGPLMMGIIGDQERMEAATISDTVNTTARLEGLTKIYGASILLTERSVKQIEDPDQYNFRFLGRMKVKGKQEALGIYEFFDGDEDVLKALKLETLGLFKEGLNQYLAKEFEQAEFIFKSILELNPDDGAVSYLSSLAHHHKTIGVPKDWNGEDIMLEK